MSKEPASCVTLKLSGKAFSCSATHTGKKCKGKEFSHCGTYYVCTVCSAPHASGALVAQLPPRNDWRTPRALWDTLHTEYRFNLDAAADVQNTKCWRYFDGSEGRDALKRDWFSPDLLAEDVRAFGNPPYSPKGSVEDWLTKAIEQASHGVFSVFLVPMATSVAWFNDRVIPYAEWHSFLGRIQFEDPLATADSARTSPKQDNLLVIYDPRSEVTGHTAVRDSKTGKRLWTRPDLA